MKKIVTMLTILAVMLVMMMGSTFAATVSVTPNNLQKVNEGEEITVTVKVNPCKGFSCVLNYDSSAFQYESSDAAVNAKESGKVKIAVLDITGTGKASTATVTFKALKAIETTQSFSVTEIDRDGESDADAVGSLVITPIVTPTPGEETNPTPDEGTPSTEPTTLSEQTNSEEQSSEETTKASSKIVGANGQVIKELPQTGAPILIGALVLVTLAGIVLVVRKIRK